MEWCCGVGRINGDDNRRKKVRFEDSEDQVDRISSLPDPILIQILSLVPTRDAIRTLLFPSLGRLWPQTYNIDFDWCVYHGCSDDSSQDSDYDNWSQARFVDFVHRALTLHKSPRISKFRLKFEYAMDDDSDDGDSLDDILSPETQEFVSDRERLAEEITSWIEHALERSVEVLDLDFLACGLPGVGGKYELPTSVYLCSSLVELKLVSCDLKFTPTYMKALKTLYLKDIILNDILMNNLLLGCPALENLSLVECFGLHDLICVSRRVKSVVVAPDIIKELIVKVYCPYITSLSIFGWIERVKLKNVASLRDATVDFCDCHFRVPDEYVVVKKVLKKLLHVKVLTLYHKPILVVMTWELTGHQCPSSKWETLILRTIMTKWHLYGIVNLLRNSPCLETLEIHIFDGELPKKAAQESWLKLEKVPEEEYWRSQGQYFACLMNSLKTVKISGDVVKDTVVKLARFLLGKAVVLEKLIISTEPEKDDSTDDGEEWKEFTEEISKCPRASSCAVVLCFEK